MNEARRQDLTEEFMEEVTEIAAEYDDGTLPLEDLIGEGYVGLMRGIRALETEEEAAESGLPVSEQIRA